jgi:glutamate 5-kinase
MNSHRTETIKNAERILIKIGSAVLTDNNGLNPEKVKDISLQIYDLIKEGKKTAVVSSGAVAAGKKRLPQYSNSRTLPAKQALAAVGQSKLINCYETVFNTLGIEVAQILLTREGLAARNRFLNAQNTLNTLLEWGVVPIINENDTVSTEELQFTDNDTLASLIVSLIDADILIILSETDALYDKDPRDFPDAKRVSFVEKVDENIMNMAGIKPGSAGRGGMKSKLLCARMVNASGVPIIIAGGNEKDILFV